MARSPSVRVVDRRLQPGEVWASKAGTGLGASVGTHFTLLWVLAGFVVLTAIICMYAGEQRHLAERQFGDVRVHDDLRVDGELSGQRVPVLNLTAAGTTALTTSQSGTLVTLDGGANVTLPKIESGDIGVSYTFLFLGGTDPSAITTTGLAALSDDFVPGAVPAVCSLAQTSATFISAVPIADGDNTITLDATGNPATDVDSGSSIKCTAIAVSAAGANVWKCEGLIITGDAAFTGADIFTAV